MKHVTKYKNMRKWIVEFLKKFENRGIKITQVNSILITKFINLLLLTLPATPHSINGYVYFFNTYDFQLCFNIISFVMKFKQC